VEGLQIYVNGFCLTANVRDAVGGKVKIEYIRIVQVEVKTEKYESRILVSIC